MFYLCILCALPILAAEHSLPSHTWDSPQTYLKTHQGIAFHAVFGTSNIAVLKSIEDNPAAYWRQRETALLSGDNAVLSHKAFHEKFVEKAKQEIQKKLPASRSWLTDVNAIDTLIKTHLSEDDPLYHHARAEYHAMACDHLSDRDTFTPFQTQEAFEKSLTDWIDIFRPEISHEFNHKMFWLTNLPDGRPSMFDALIMRSQGLLLSAVPEGYNAFNVYGGRFQFLRRGPVVDGWWEAIVHERTRGLQQHTREETLKTLGITMQTQFDTYCSPERLISDNLMELARQIQGAFYNDIELPSCKQTLETDDQQSLLFPTTELLTDPSLTSVTPYFMDHKIHANWRQCPITPILADHNIVHIALLDWRERYCIRNGAPAKYPALFDWREYYPTQNTHPSRTLKTQRTAH